MTSRPPTSSARRASSQQIAAAAGNLRNLESQLRRLRAPDPSLAEVTTRIGKELGFSNQHVGRLLQRAGITSPLRRTLTAEAIDRFIAEAREARATYPDPRTRAKGAKSAAVKVTAPKNAVLKSSVTAWRASSEQLSAAGRTLTSYQRWSRDRSQQPPTMAELTRELALDLSFHESHVRRLLREAHIADPLSATMGHSNIGRFLRATEVSTVTYPGPYPQRSAVEMAAAPSGTKREQKMARVRAAFRAHRAVLDDPGLTDSPLEELVAAVSNASGIPADRIAEAMQIAGVVEPQRLTVTAEAVESVIAEAFNCAPADAESWPSHTPVPRTAPGRYPVHARFAGPDQLAAVRLVLRSAREEIEAAGQTNSLHLAELARRVANTLTFSLEHAAALLSEADIREPLHRTLKQRRIDRFIRVAYTSAARYPVPAPITKPSAATAHKAPEAPDDAGPPLREAASLQFVNPTGPIPQLGAELMDEQALAAYVQRMSNRSTTPGADPSTAPDPAAVRAVAAYIDRKSEHPVSGENPADAPDQRAQPQLQQQLQTTQPKALPKHRSPQYPACQRLAEHWATSTPANRMADLYLALIELTTYRSTPQAQALAEIAADRFGIHTDATTGARLNDRATLLWRAGEGGAQLDHLSRLERRMRGVFYDGHRDRITAWDSSTKTMLLYTCTGAELRTAAQAAHDYGDLIIPAMRHQSVGPTSQPTGAEDPALLLAVAADQLGRQAARRLHPSTPIPRHERLEQPAATKPATRSVSAATWVQPVSGDWGQLVIGHLDRSYARHTPGPRSRAATTVREFMRRAPGTAKNAEKTVKVQSHHRKGTGPGDPTPTVTRVSGRQRLWR
ncbi:hypothetical protein [Kocuria sabuli]|uniref:hypothetical protein n=1 Tax=Kocuria sabuli TaxID=3071448 RepID=UPI0034D49999